MLSQDICDKYADVLMWGLTTARSESYKKNDVILVRFSREALPVAEALQKKILEQGMNPVLRLAATAVMERQFFEIANDRQLAFKGPGEKEFYDGLNGSVYLLAPESLTHLSHVDPARMGKAALARKTFREILDRREQEGEFGWTLGIVPTKELAEKAGTRMPTYVKHWKKACCLDVDDPVGRWKEIFENAKKLKAWLNSMEVTEFNVKTANMDLTVTPGKDRKWIGISGHNIPSFEIFLSPDWRGTRGTYYADQPSYRSGNYVEGVSLTFEDGIVTKARAQKGEDFLKKQVAMDEGAARVGEFSLTDRRFSPISRFMANTLFDENFGGRQGNCHLALGSSYADTYAHNPKGLTPRKKKSLGFNDSALHWDLVNTEQKTVTATLSSGETQVIYKNGEFQCPDI